MFSLFCEHFLESSFYLFFLLYSSQTHVKTHHGDESHDSAPGGQFAVATEREEKDQEPNWVFFNLDIYSPQDLYNKSQFRKSHKRQFYVKYDYTYKDCASGMMSSKTT